MADQNLQQDWRLPSRRVTFPVAEPSTKATHSSPASLLKVPRRKPETGRSNPGAFSRAGVHVPTRLQPKKSVTFYHSDDNACSTPEAQPPVKVQEASSWQKKKAAIRRSAQDFSAASEGQYPITLPETKAQAGKNAAMFHTTQDLDSTYEAQSLIYLPETKAQPKKIAGNRRSTPDLSLGCEGQHGTEFPETKSQPRKNAVKRRSTQDLSSGCEAQHSTKFPEIKTQPGKNVVIHRSTQDLSSGCEGQYPSGKLPDTKSQPRMIAGIVIGAAPAIISEQELPTPPVRSQKVKFRPNKSLTICPTTLPIGSPREASTPDRIQTFQPRTSAAIHHEKQQTFDFEQAPQAHTPVSPLQTDPEDLPPKRKRSVRQSSEMTSADGKAEAGVVVKVALKDTSSQTDPVVIFVGNVGSMAERLKQLEQWGSQTVLDGNDVLVDVSYEGELQRQNLVVVPPPQPPEPSSKQESDDDDVICLDGCPTPKKAVGAESGACSIGQDKGFVQSPSEKAEPRSKKRKRQGRDERQEECQSGRDWQDSSGDQCQRPDVKQLEDCPASSERQGRSSRRRLRQAQCVREEEELEDPTGRQGQFRNEKQWQDWNEKQWHDQNRKQCGQGPSEMQWQGQELNEKQWTVPNEVQWQDQQQNVNQGRAPDKVQWCAEEQTENQLKVANEKQWHDEQQSENQWKAPDGKQWQCQQHDENQWKATNEAQWYSHEQNVNQLNTPNEKQLQDRNEGSLVDQNPVQFQDENKVQCQNPNEVQYHGRKKKWWQDPNEIVCLDENEVKGQESKEVQEIQWQKPKEVQEMLLQEPKEVQEVQWQEPKEVQAIQWQKPKEVQEVQWQEPKEAQEMLLQEPKEAQEVQWQEPKEAQEVQWQEPKEAQEMLLQDPKEVQLQDLNEMQWKTVNKIQCHGPDDKQDKIKKRSHGPDETQWQDPNHQQRQDPTASRGFERSVSKRRNPKQRYEQAVHEKQRQDQGETQGSDPLVSRAQDPNEIDIKDPTSEQGFDVSLSEGQDPVSNQGQDPKEKRRRGPNKKRGEGVGGRGMRGRTPKRGQPELYTELRPNHSVEFGLPLKTEPRGTESMLTLFKDFLGSAESKRGRGVRVRGGSFRKSTAGVFIPALSSPSGLSPADWDQVALSDLSDSGVLYEELNKSQSLVSKPRAGRRCVKPRAG